MPILFDILYAVGVCLAAPFLLIRRLRRGPGSLSISERLGGVPVRPVSARCVWIHAVSLGEVNATRTLVRELRKRSPDVVIAISATTQTGLTQARTIYSGEIVFRFPLDFSFIIRRVLNRLRPTVIVLMELEVWPNCLELARRAGVPVMIANGRVTEQKSMRRFQSPLIRPLSRWMFKRINWVGAQDETYADRFRQLGVPADRVEVVGSMKYDAADTADWIEGQTELGREMTIDPLAPLWVCGSTGVGEEAMILDAYAALLPAYPELQLAIIPRRPERFDEVAALVASRGYACLRRDADKPPVVPPGVDTPRPVFLGDTMGELRKFYALATVVFVGRSLIPEGGSDVMEVAGLSKAMIVGPHTGNFAEPVALLKSRKACIVVENVRGLMKAVADLLADHAARKSMGEEARAAILSRRGATAVTARRILDRC